MARALPSALASCILISACLAAMLLSGGSTFVSPKPNHAIATAGSPSAALRGAVLDGEAALLSKTPPCSIGVGVLAVGAAAATLLLNRGRHRSNSARKLRVAGRAQATLEHAVQQGAPVNPEEFVGVDEQTGITLSRYMIELTKRGIIDEDMQSIFNSIREATKVIAKLVNRAPLSQAELLGLQGEINVQGEDQKKLDVITNDVLKKALQYSGKLGVLASEEEDNPVSASDSGNTLLTETGKYVCVFDPLDGSSNVDAGIAVGTIFGIFEEDADANVCELVPNAEDLDEQQVQCIADTLQPGKALLAAGYVLYSCSTELVLTLGRGCVGFTLDSSIGEFVLTRPHIQIPPRGKIYSCNEGNKARWDDAMQKYIKDIQQGKGETGNKYSLRYIGSMVGDIHRTLLYGGVFAYPADTKNPDGKLRLLYEAAPMSFIIEQAGGKAITGHSRVMDIPPVKVHQRVPIICGSREDVEECQRYYEKYSDPAVRARCEARLKGEPSLS